MSGVAAAILLFAGCALAAVAALGLLIARDAVDRLHLSGVLTSAAAILIGAAVILDGASASTSAELALVVIVLLVGGPLTTHALARAFRIRARGDWDMQTGVTPADRITSRDNP